MNSLAFEFDVITMTGVNTSDVEKLLEDLNKKGKLSWYPASIPPLPTPFGLKIFIQRAKVGSSTLLNEETGSGEQKREPEPSSRLIL